MITKYLKMLGMKAVEQLPAAFKPTYSEEWDTFRLHFKNPSKDPLRAAFYLCLEFIRYMKAIKINPFARVVSDPITHLTFLPARAYELVFTEFLQGFGDHVTEQFRRLRFTGFKVINNAFSYEVSKNFYTLRYTVIIAHTSKQLTTVLNEQRGLLFSRELPVQLKNSRGLDAATALIHVSNELGWLKLKSTPISVYVARARNDLLVVRFTHQIPEEISFGTPLETRAHITKMWKKVKIVLNCK